MKPNSKSTRREERLARWTLAAFSFALPLLGAGCSTGAGAKPAGGGEEDPGDVDPGEPLDPVDPGGEGVLLLDGPAIATEGEPFVATLIALAETEEPLAFRLESGPRGMQVEPFTGLVTWIPEADQVGAQEASFRAFNAELTLDHSVELRVQGRRAVGGAFVSAAAGGVVDVNDATSSFLGSRIAFPPGALAADQEIEFLEVQESPLAPAGLPVFALEPSQPFAAAVHVEIAYTEDFLTRFDIEDETRLCLYVFDEEEQRWTRIEGCTVDASSRMVHADLHHFSLYTIFVEGLEALAALTEDGIEFLVELFVGTGQAALSVTEKALNMAADFYQGRELISVKGAGFRHDQKNALLVHGIFSSDENFDSLKAFACAKYDNVLFYNYPSSAPIRWNALWLASRIRSQKERFKTGSSFDVYAHSMGGLVARSVIEQDGLSLILGGNQVSSLVTLGTPHLGGSPADALDFFQATFGSTITGAALLLGDILTTVTLTPGLRDLLPGSVFLQNLNRPGRFQGWTQYFLIGGGAFNGTNDGWVDRSSALPVGLLSATGIDFVPYLNHSGLHEELSPTGLHGDGLFRAVKPVAMNTADIVKLSAQLNAEDHDGDACFDVLDGQSTYDFGSNPVDFGVPPLSAVRSGWKVSCNGEEVDFYGHFYVLTNGHPALQFTPVFDELGVLLEVPLWHRAVAFPVAPYADRCPCDHHHPAEEPPPAITFEKVLQVYVGLPTGHPLELEIMS